MEPQFHEDPVINQQILDSITRTDAARKGIYLHLIDIAICGGDHEAASVLSRIIFWFSPDDEGRVKLRRMMKGRLWLVKDHKDWYAELLLSRKQITRCLNVLRKLNLIETEIHRWGELTKNHISFRADIYWQLREKHLAENRSLFEFKLTTDTSSQGATPDAPNGASRLLQTAHPLTGNYIPGKNKKEKKNTSYSFQAKGSEPSAPSQHHSPGKIEPVVIQVQETKTTPLPPSTHKDKIQEIVAATRAKNTEAAAKKSTAKTKTPVGELLDHYLEAFLSKYPNCSMLPDTKGKVAGNAKALLERCHGDIATAKSLITFWIENFESLKKGALSWAQDLEEPLLTKLYLFLDRIRPEYERAQAKKEDSNTENDYIIQPFTLRRPTND